MWCDEATFTLAPTQRLLQALKKRGVPAKILDQALDDLAA